MSIGYRSLEGDVSWIHVAMLAKIILDMRLCHYSSLLNFNPLCQHALLLLHLALTAKSRVIKSHSATKEKLENGSVIGKVKKIDSGKCMLYIT